MEKYLALIQQSVLLRSISTMQMQKLLADGHIQINRYGKDNIIHFAGDICAKLEIILSGHVTVERIDEAGNLMTIAEFYSDEILGGNLLFSKQPRYPMTITAKQPTVVLAIKKECLLQLFATHHTFLKSYLEYVADHAVVLGDRLQYYVNRSIRECILADLEHERQKQNSNLIRLPFTKKAWAERMGVQRTSVSRELAKMRQDGLIRYDNKTIELL